MRMFFAGTSASAPQPGLVPTRLMQGVRALAFGLLGGMAVASPASAALLITDANGFLTGAQGVSFGGKTYDVTFMDGACPAGPTCVSPFASGGAGSPLQGFSQALMNQVFAEGSIFDLAPERIRGCTSIQQCNIFLPGLMTDPTGYRVQVFDGAANQTPSVNPFFRSDTALVNAAISTRGYIREVPVPASLPLVAASLGLLALLRRRRS